MNLYTRIWLKLAPKGWRETDKKIRSELERLKKENEALRWIVEENEKLERDMEALKGTNAYLFKSLVNLREYYSISRSKQGVYNSLAHHKEGE